MATYPANMAAHGPCRSLADYRTDLRSERITLLHRQLLAENEAADCERRIERINARLRAIDAAASAGGEVRERERRRND